MTVSATAAPRSLPHGRRLCGPHLLLASVRSVDEALLARAGGADIIDAKESRTAFGRLDPREVARMRTQLPDAVLSATLGDPSDDVPGVIAAARQVAGAGVDFIKVAVPRGRVGRGLVLALGKALGGPEGGGSPLVGVLAAGADFGDGILAAMADAGFAGVMVDTFDKGAGTLREVMPLCDIAAFVGASRGLGLFAGLAGSLKENDIAPLLTVSPDILGFRGALCFNAERAGAIDPAALARVRAAMPRQPHPAGALA